MRIFHSIEELNPEQFSSPVSLTIGVFDGVHSGHQALLTELVNWAGHGDSVVVTFDTHPRKVLNSNPPKLLTSLEHRLYLLEKLGLSACLVLPFDDKWANVSATQFLKLLKKHLGIERLLLGANHRFGKGREGSAEFASQFTSELNFALREFQLKTSGPAISSTRIRNHVAAGELDSAESLLGRKVSLFGKVVKGFQRGRTIGFPTANLEISSDTLTPPFGVYPAFASCAGQFTDKLAVVNIGKRPTFDDSSEVSVEAHIIDYEGDLYEHQIELKFEAQIRAEKRFNGVDELVAQIAADKAFAIEKYGKKNF